MGSNAGDFSINDYAIDGFLNETAELMKISEEHLQARLDEATADLSSKQQELDRFFQRINEVKTEQHIANNAKNNGRDYRAMTGRRSRRADPYQRLTDRLYAANE